MTKSLVVAPVVLLLVAASLTACARRSNGRGGGGGTDGETRTDAGSSAMADGGGTDGSDGGISEPEPDPDAGTDPDPSATCDPDPIENVRGTFCEDDATRTCYSECPDGDCRTDCLRADSNPNCIRCVNQNVIACAVDNGCDREVELHECCIDDECGDSPASECIAEAGGAGGACEGTFTAYRDCVVSLDLASLCPSIVADCFE